MVSKSADSTLKLKRGNGDSAYEVFGTLSMKVNQLKKQIQAERVISVKEKFEKNRKKLQSHVGQVVLANASKGVASGCEKLSSRIQNPISKFSGIAQGSGDKDYVQGHEVLSSTSTKLPYTEKIPPYTTWIFLDRNQRMAEDQSVVGRRRIYYDQYGSEALICSDSEEEVTEHEEEKHEFSESEDRILWMAFQEHGISEDIMNFVSQSVGGTTLEIQERYNTLKVKYSERHDQKGSEEIEMEKSSFLDKTLSSALDSFDNLFCRRCLVFDCRLHGCSQNLINPCEKQSSGSELEEDATPCSDQCYLQLKLPKEFPEGCDANALQTMEMESLETEEMTSAPFSCDEQIGGKSIDNAEDRREITDNLILDTSETSCGLEIGDKALDLDTSTMAVTQNESAGNHKVVMNTNPMLQNSQLVSDDIWSSPSKKQKNLSTSDAISGSSEILRVPYNVSSVENQDNGKDKAKVTMEVPEKEQMSISLEGQNQLSPGSKWKPIEKELYLKGVEIFGRNSCLIARNLLSGLKTCIEVSSYMYDETAMPNKSFVASLFAEDDGKTDMDQMVVLPRQRFFRRRGRTRKLKYSWKSAGHPSIWKRIADGKNQSCKQYTPCGCQSMCGKQCPCQDNGTCCEKYCGCSKSCKNRFRGCHCAKSQCRSRQCPCFAAGRECDPDVCRNCWVSCGKGSLGEPPRRGDGQCGNMRLLLRQQQKILLAKSDVAGWGAFIKNSVNKNDYLGEYTGELISHREADKRGKIYDRANSSFLFDLNDQYVLDAYRKGDKLKFANHSSNPNCYAKVMLVAGDHRVGIFAKEHIEASEELFYDYRYGPDQAPAWARKPEGSKRDDTMISQGRAKKHQSH